MKEIIKDVDGKISSKRTLLFASFGMLFISWLTSMFMDKQPSDTIINNITYCIGLGFAAVASEKAFRKNIKTIREDQKAFHPEGPEEIIITHKNDQS